MKTVSELSQILEYWKGYMSAQRLVSDPSRWLYGLSEHEMALARIGDEFEQSLSRTSAAKDAIHRETQWPTHRYRCCYAWIDEEGHVWIVKTPQSRNLNETWEWLCGQWDGWRRLCDSGNTDGKLIRVSYAEKISP